jgi:hypothetical protein
LVHKPLPPIQLKLQKSHTDKKLNNIKKHQNLNLNVVQEALRYVERLLI